MSNVLVCGTRATGKSTKALDLARKFGGTVVIRDSRGSFSQIGIQCHSIEELQDHLESGDYVIEKDGVREIQPLVVKIDTLDQEKAFTELCDVLFPPNFEGYQGKLAIVIDEAANLQSSQYICPALNRLVGQHPIKDILVIQTTHEIKEWNSKCKSCMEELYLFYQVGTANYDRIEELCGQDVAEQVKSFEPTSKDDPRIHYYVRYSFVEFFEVGKRWEVNEDPASWYADLGDQNSLPANRVTEETTTVYSEG
jgi:hypothetical protein